MLARFTGLGVAAGTGIGALITRWLYQGRVDSLSQSNVTLLELTRTQQEHLNNLLSNTEALRVEVQSAQFEAIETSLQATQTAWDLREYRVEATAEAYSRDEEGLEEIMSRMPLSLVSNSCKISLNISKPGPYGETQYFEASGSGTITLYDERRNILVCLSAGHVLRPESGFVIDGLGISQPHLREEKIEFYPDRFRIFCDETKDLGITVIDVSQHFMQGRFQQEIDIDENWVPRTGEELYSLSFPVMAERGIGYTPSELRVVRMNERDQIIQEVIGDSVICAGASGAAVVKPEGPVVGVYVALGALGSYLIPVGDTYSQLLDTADLL